MHPKILRIFALLAVFYCGAFATVSSTTTKAQYVLASQVQTLSVPFVFNLQTDLYVTDSATSPVSVLTLNSDYSVAGGSGATGSITTIAGGTGNVQSGDTITILRNVPFTQTTSYTSGGVFNPRLLEANLDKLTTAVQELGEISSRSLRFQPDENVDGTMTKSLRANKFIFFDVNGNLTYSTGTGTGGGGTTYTAGAGLLLASNEFSVNPVQSLSSLTVTNPISGGVTGNAGTATTLATPRAINGVNFNGSADITVPAAAGTLTGSSLNSGVTAAPGLLSAAVGAFGTMAIQTASNVNISGGTIANASVTGLPAPASSTDAATKAYVDSISAGIVPRSAVVAATTANITLSGAQTIDGQAVIAGNRVLVKNQSTTSQNGIYDCAAGAWSRSSDSDTAAELKFGYYYFVSAGTTQGATSWFIQTAPTTINTDPVLFAQFAASVSYTAGSNLGLAGNVFSLSPAVSSITLNNSAIGNTTPSTGAFTTVNAAVGTAGSPSYGFAGSTAGVYSTAGNELDSGGWSR